MRAKRADFAPILEKKIHEEKRNLKKFRIKISMVKPYEIVDFWVKKPDIVSALETFIHHEMFTLDANEYFKVEISAV